MGALGVQALSAYDTCPKCGGRKRSKNNQCSDCRGYGRGRHIMPSGYVRLWKPGHPLANADGYLLEHIYVLHEAGFVIPAGWHTHHVDGDKQNNDLDNLVVCTPKAHKFLHLGGEGEVRNQFGTHRVRARRPCATCGTPFKPWKATGRYCSRSCSNRRGGVAHA